MTSSTSSRSVRGTRKTAAKRDSNGTPPTDPPSEPTSSPTTENVEIQTGWMLQFANGGVQHVRVTGGRGRISFSQANRGIGGEVRIYRNESTKVYDAVFTNVVHVTSDRTVVIPSKWGDGDRTMEPRMGGHPEPEPPKEEAVQKHSIAGKTFSMSFPARIPLNPDEF